MNLTANARQDLTEVRWTGNTCKDGSLQIELGGIDFYLYATPAELMTLASQLLEVVALYSGEVTEVGPAWPSASV